MLIGDVEDRVILDTIDLLQEPYIWFSEIFGCFLQSWNEIYPFLFGLLSVWVYNQEHSSSMIALPGSCGG